MIKKIIILIILVTTFLFAEVANSCISCHDGLAPIREHSSKIIVNKSILMSV